MTAIVSKVYVQNVHSKLEQDKRCLSGIRDHNLFNSAIEGQNWYENPTDQIIHVAYSICANHVYNDGNKRTAFLTLKLLETKLGYACDWPNIAQAVLDLATFSTPKEAFFHTIRSNIIV